MIHCAKTGQYWPAASYGIATSIARQKGLTDWEWTTPETPAKP